VAAAARDLGRPVGAILHALGGHPSPEARAAVAAFLDAAPDLPSVLVNCASGRELADRGLAADLAPAAAHDVSRTVPRLEGGAFAQLS
jgi:2-phosphosulfolactate phosphatase